MGMEISRFLRFFTIFLKFFTRKKFQNQKLQN